MFRFLIFIILILNSNVLLSKPSGLLLELMNEKVSHLTYGVNRCKIAVEKNIPNVERILYNYNINFEVGFEGCFYNFNNNKINIYYYIAERTSSTTIDPNVEITNKTCAKILRAIIGNFVFKAGDEVYNTIVQEFGNVGYSIPMDKNINKDLKDYIEIYTGSNYGTRCKAKLDWDSEILFLQ